MQDSGADRRRTWTDRRRAELEQRWPYGLGIVVLGVIVPVAAGYPDPEMRFGHLDSEMVVAMVALVVFAGLLLVLASAICRTGRAAWFGVAGIVLIAAHPMLGGSFEGYPPGTALLRTGLAAGVVVVRCVTMDVGLFGRALRNAGAGLVPVAIIASAGDVAAGGSLRLEATAALALSAAVVAVGVIDFVKGQRDADGAAAFLGMTLLSFGFGGLMLLASGGGDLTQGVAWITLVTSICAAAAAVMAVFEALAGRESRLEAVQMSAALAVARLGEQSHRFAQVSHDQRGALLAIEAAAQRLRERPSDELAAAVAAEAARLQRTLAEETEACRRFDLETALQPMVTCIQSMGGEIAVVADAPVMGWGAVDEVVEVVRALVENARVHGTMPIEITLTRAGDHAMISVTDHGRGVAPALHESIFDRGVTTDPRNHTGLGLSAARRSAEGLGGSLAVSTTRPATFELLIPSGPPAMPDVPIVIDLDDLAPVAHLGRVDSA